MIWLAGIVVGMVGSLLMVVCVGVILLPAGMIFLLVLAVMGLINAVKGEQKPIPVIGKYAEDWFKGISKV